MPRAIGIPHGMEKQCKHLNETTNVGYRHANAHYKMTMTLYQVVAMLLAGVKFKFRSEIGGVVTVSNRSSSKTIRELLSHPDMIWWGHTIEDDVVRTYHSPHTAYSHSSRQKMMRSMSEPVKQAILRPGDVLTRAMQDTETLNFGMHVLLVDDLKISSGDSFASYNEDLTMREIVPIPPTTDTTNQNTQNQENTNMSTTHHPASLTTRSVETKAGWVGQVMHGQSIVWESQPVPNNVEVENGYALTPDHAAQQLATDAVAEFYRSAFEEVTVKGFEAKAKGKK